MLPCTRLNLNVAPSWQICGCAPSVVTVQIKSFLEEDVLFYYILGSDENENVCQRNSQGLKEKT